MMEFLKIFIIRYFVLLCLSAILYLNSIQRYRQHPEISKNIIIITSLALFLAFSNIMEEVGKAYHIIPLVTVFAFFGYVIRPICLYFFILMSGVRFKKPWNILSLIPLGIVIIVYALAFIPGINQYIYTFSVQEGTNAVVFEGGPLRYTSHIVSLGYLILLLFFAFRSLKYRHLTHLLSVIACALFVIFAVLIETFLNAKGDYFFLTTTIAVSALQYYLYLYIEKSQIDPLTGLYNRETYYSDLPKMDKAITGVIQFDMNGLKYLNDNYGHEEGDKALATIAKLIVDCSTRNMYIYRMGGDEFLLIAIKTTDEQIQKTVHTFKEKLKETPYYCSIGYMHRDDKNMPIDDLLKEAEKYMYEEKARFYEKSPFERRKN